MIALVKNGQIFLRADNGRHIRSFGSNIKTAALNNDETLVVATKDNNKMVLYNTKQGTMLRQAAVTGIVDARFSGDNIAITLDNGVVRLVKQNGQLIRTIR